MVELAYPYSFPISPMYQQRPANPNDQMFAGDFGDPLASLFVARRVEVAIALAKIIIARQSQINAMSQLIPILMDSRFSSPSL